MECKCMGEVRYDYMVKKRKNSGRKIVCSYKLTFKYEKTIDIKG